MTDCKREVNVKDFGALGDGRANDRPAIQRALDSGAEKIVVPLGTYVLDGTLYIGSDVCLEVHPLAMLVLADGAMKGPKDFMLTNKNWETGDKNITVRGGIWDYNNPGNRRGELFDPNSITGTQMHFHNAENLVLENLFLRDPECYFITLLDTNRFRIENVLFDSPHLRPNQDGIHLGGDTYNGIIRGLRGTPGSCNDDVVAFSADNCMTRLQNLNLHCGNIGNILIEDADFPHCFTFVRIASIDSTVENVVIRNVRAGVSHFFLNLDATHESRTPVVFREEERYYTGVGHVKNVEVSDCRIWSTTGKEPLMAMEEGLENFTMRHITVEQDKLAQPPLLRMRLCRPTRTTLSGVDKGALEKLTMEKCDLHVEEGGKGKADAVLDKHVYGAWVLPATDIREASFGPLKE